ncbi:MAG TPA: metal-sensitive transcriptional regulator [Thermomicrobiales bacterium]|nr:metal-sensitive transcriptional regulator [Thermomicrobiales bacterium]
MGTDFPMTEATSVTSCCSPDHSDSYAKDKAKLLARLRRIEGQVRGVGRMIEEDKYCIDILTQISAIISSSQSVGLLLLQDHIRGCVVDAQPEDREDRLEELNRAIERFTRSVR